jgi:hypothetical protein
VATRDFSVWHRETIKAYGSVVDIVSHSVKREKHRLDETGTDGCFQKKQDSL